MVMFCIQKMVAQYYGHVLYTKNGSTVFKFHFEWA